MRILIPIALFFCSFSALLTAEGLRISASDLLSDYIEEPLNAAAQQRDTSYQVKGGGSLPALQLLEAGKVDLAIVAIPAGEALPEGDFTVQSFVYATAVVVVSQDNPLDELSLAQLGGIFGPNEALNLTNWGQFQLPGWESRGIKAVAAQNSESVALELFKHQVLSNDELKTGVSVLKQPQVERLVESDLGVIAVLPGLPKSAKLKPLMLSTDSTKPAFGPNENNIHYGDYPLRLAFYLVYRSSDAQKLDPVFSILYGEEVTELLRQNNLFCLPDTVRRKVRTDLQFIK